MALGRLPQGPPSHTGAPIDVGQPYDMRHAENATAPLGAATGGGAALPASARRSLLQTWADRTLTFDKRATLLLSKMTAAEKGASVRGSQRQ